MQLIAVVGMHRSGTSATAGTLARLGVEFGGRLMPPTLSNPRGYYEDLLVVGIHDRLLRALGRSWCDPRPLPEGWECGQAAELARARLVCALGGLPQAQMLGVKDPRMSRLAPLWKFVALDLGRQLVPVVVRRGASAVIASLARREGWSRARARELAMAYARDLAAWRAFPEAVVVHFESMMADWKITLTPLARKVPLHQQADAAVEVEGFLERDLVHHA